MTSLTERYQLDIEQGFIIPDPEQQRVLNYLQRLEEELLLASKKSQWVKLLNFFQQQDPVRGLYLWGEVGIGKTYLMDIFFECLPIKRQLRMHFHQFMQEVHEALRRLQGKANPLEIVAHEFSERTDILGFDEFVVNDITDAMLLANLFDALFKRGVSLLATSNVAPDHLYANGLQRSRFLPAIDLIKRHTEVIHLTTKVDYRLQTLQQAGTYFTPLNSQSKKAMYNCFLQLTHHAKTKIDPLIIEDRPVGVLGLSQEVAWFDFSVICAVPRSQMDYLEIAKSFTTVLISNVPKIYADEHDKVTYLINLIDIFYDKGVKLILSAEVGIDEIYQEGRKLTEFQRTKSRLREMQSEEYLHRGHEY